MSNPISELNDFSHSVGSNQPKYEKLIIDEELSPKFSIKVTFSDITAFGKGSTKVSKVTNLRLLIINLSIHNYQTLVLRLEGGKKRSCKEDA